MKDSIIITRTYEWETTCEIKQTSSTEFEVVLTRKNCDSLWDDEEDEIYVEIDGNEFHFDGLLDEDEEEFIKKSILLLTTKTI
jgi:hypothetical protein